MSDHSKREMDAWGATVEGLRALGFTQQTGRTRSRCKCDAECFYCDASLKGEAHHHDHFPIPARYGGELTVAACGSCHKMKETARVDQWPADAFAEVIREMQDAGPWTRFAFAKLFTQACHWYERAAEKPKYPNPRGADW